MFQPGVAWPHLAATFALVAASALAVKLKRVPALWGIAAATCTSVCILIPVVGHFQASHVYVDVPREYWSLLPGWLFWRWDQPVAFCIYAALLVCLLTFRRLTGFPSAPPWPMRPAVTVGFLLFNAPFLAAPLVGSTALKLVVMSPDQKPLSRAWVVYRSWLTGGEYSQVGDDGGVIRLRLLWHDTIEGDISSPGHLPDHLYISLLDGVALPDPPGNLSVDHNYAATPQLPRVRQVSYLADPSRDLPVYLPVEGRLEPLPYQDVVLLSKHLIDHQPAVDHSLTGEY